MAEGLRTPRGMEGQESVIAIIKQDLAWQPLYSLEEGIRRTFGSYGE